MILLEQNSSHFSLIFVINVKNFNDSSTSILFTCNGAVCEFAFRTLRVKNNIQDLFMIFTYDKFWYFFTFLLTCQMQEDNLNFGDDSNESLLIIKNNSVGRI